jgi:glucokinase
MAAFEEVRHSTLRGGPFILVADIGGTHTNFAILQEKGFKLYLKLNFNSKDISNFTTTVNEVLQHLKKNHGLHITNSCFAPAGVISRQGQLGTLTNLPWKINSKDLLKNTPLTSIILINDFTAIALGISHLPQKILQVKQGKPVKYAPIAILGAGTGLGKNIMLYDKKQQLYLPNASEGGHANLVIQNKEELELLQFIQKQDHNRTVAWEDVLSGRGLSNIYKFLARHHRPTRYSKEIMHSKYNPELISKYRTKDQLCKATYNKFTQFYGRCAKNLALDTLAQGGIYIAGGIAAKNHAIFKQKIFHSEFLQTKKLATILKQIPIYVITDYNVSLYGAAQAAVLHKKGVI